ncbi:MAG TPA: FtsQ-type POTRA domain-containing protein [Chroococcales cyanobacterium]|jgi:cell division protein FtsQ
MASLASVSQSQLTNRRKQLRRARRIRSVQALWRSLFVGGLVSALGWGITSSDLVIRQPEQIAIEGNHFLSAQAIRSLLPLSYPQSLLQVQPQTLAKELESQGPISEATVSRQLLPPGLTIQVKERKPVAIAIGTATPQNSKTARSTSPEGLLDEQGVWMPASSYQSVEHDFELPTLKVIGSSDRYRPYWSDLYQSVSHSPVKVFEIDWQNPANLILKTELGKVYLGPYSSRVAEQLAILDRMRELPTHVNPSQIAYIDLTNPEVPAIQMLKGNDTVRASAD